MLLIGRASLITRGSQMLYMLITLTYVVATPLKPDASVVAYYPQAQCVQQANSLNALRDKPDGNKMLIAAVCIQARQ